MKLNESIMKTLTEGTWQKLITKREEALFAKYPLGSQDGKGMDARVLCKFFNPMGAGTWIVIEANKEENGDYEFFGYAEIGYGYEMGYFTLSELQSVKLPWGMKIERDQYSVDNNTKVRDLISEDELM